MAADNVITDARRIGKPTAAYQNDGVFLKIVTDTGYVRPDFLAVGQAYSGDFSET